MKVLVALWNSCPSIHCLSHCSFCCWSIWDLMRCSCLHPVFRRVRLFSKRQMDGRRRWTTPEGPDLELPLTWTKTRRYRRITWFRQLSWSNVRITLSRSAHLALCWKDHELSNRGLEPSFDPYSALLNFSKKNSLWWALASLWFSLCSLCSKAFIIPSWILDVIKCSSSAINSLYTKIIMLSFHWHC